MESIGRTTLFDIYPELAKAPLPSDIANPVGSPAPSTGSRVNWPIIILLATAGVGLYFFIRWPEEKRREG